MNKASLNTELLYLIVRAITLTHIKFVKLRNQRTLVGAGFSYLRNGTPMGVSLFMKRTILGLKLHKISALNNSLTEAEQLIN